MKPEKITDLISGCNYLTFFMDELKYLDALREIVSNEHLSETDDRSAKSFITQVNKILNAIRKEALATPAGQRWFKGQLKIHTALSLFNSDRSSDIANHIKDLEAEQRLSFYKKIFKETDALVQSGINRYISG